MTERSGLGRWRGHLRPPKASPELTPASQEGASAENPYVGPRPFEAGDRGVFYGRWQETQKLAALVVARQAVVLYAQSGAGKTSLLQAGLIPHLQETENITVLPLSRVGGDLPDGIDGEQADNIYVFNTLYNMAGREAQPRDLLGLSLNQGLERHIEAGESHRPVLLALDQLEELFTTYPDRYEEWADFFRQLKTCLDDYAQLSLLLALREDYIAHLDSYAGHMPDRLRARFRLEPLRYEAALAAVKTPAQMAGRPFDEGVAEDLVNNLRRVQPGKRISPAAGADGVSALGAYVEPVHLQLVCRQLWANLPPERVTILAEDVQEFGDVDQALRGFYESALDKALADPDVNVAERMLRQWFEDELITPARTKGLVYRGDEQTKGLSNSAVDTLKDAYIVRAEVRGGDTWYELAHDRLVEPILESNRRWQRRYYNPLEQPTQAWLEAGRAKEKLLGRAQLKEAQVYAERHPLELTDDEKDFLEAARRAARRQRNVIIATVLVIAALIGLSGWALIMGAKARDAQAEAERQADIALARQLAAQAQGALDTDPTQALLLAVQAVTTTWNLRDAAGQQLRLAEVDQALRDSLQAPHGLPLSGPESGVVAVAFSPDGRWLATAGGDGITRLWDMGDRNASPRKLEGHKLRVWRLTFSPDSRWLVTASTDGTAWLWDLETGEAIHPLRGHGDKVKALDVSPDSRQVATGGADGTARLWDLETGHELHKLPGHDAPVNAVEFSPDGHLLATAGDDGTARLWDVESGKELRLLSGHAGWLNALEFSPDGRWLATGGGDNTARLWDLETGEALHVLDGHKEPVTAISFSPDGHWVATASEDKTARLWDAETGEVHYTLQGHRDWINDLEFSPDGRRLVTVSDDHTARIWDVETGDELQVLRGHEDKIMALDISPDGRWLATADQVGSTRLWNVDDPSPEPRIFRGHQGPVNVAGFSPDGRWLATASTDGTARLWDPETGGELQTLSGHSDSVIALSFSPDGRLLATASRDATARLWDPETGEELQTLSGHSDSVIALSFSPDGRLLATASTDTTARLWDVATGRALLSLAGHEDSVNAVSFSPDGRFLATTSNDGTSRLWDVATGDKLAALDRQQGWVIALAFSPDGHRLATAGDDDGTARLWDVPSGEVRYVLRGHDREVTALAFSPDGRRLATASEDGTARLWDVETGDALQILQGHGDRIRALSFSPDGRWLATASWDKTARVWDITSPNPQAVVLRGHEDWLNAVAFSPDGRWLATASADGTARLWRQDVADLVGLACELAGRNFAKDEWERFFGEDTPYAATCPHWPVDPAALESAAEDQGG